MAGDIEARLKALDLVLPEIATPRANYVPFLHLDRLLVVSGQLPMREGQIAVAGRLGADLDIAKGEEAAKLCALNILAQAKVALYDLDRIVQCLRLNGFVNASPEFTDHAKVLNGASDLLVKVLGEKGRHTRVAVGCASLPLGAAVEVDALFAIDQRASPQVGARSVEIAERPLLTSAIAPPDIIAYDIAAPAADRARVRRYADATIEGFMP